MTLTPELVAALVDASSKLQAAHAVAKRTGHLDVAAKLKDVAWKVAGVLAMAAREYTEDAEVYS